jgi:hypothetical protein
MVFSVAGFAAVGDAQMVLRRNHHPATTLSTATMMKVKMILRRSFTLDTQPQGIGGA